MNIKFSPIRDTIAAGVGLMGAGVGIFGGLAKKAFIAEDSSFAKRFAVGTLATLMTGGLGLASYLIASPGRQTQAEIQNAKNDAVNNRYS